MHQVLVLNARKEFDRWRLHSGRSSVDARTSGCFKGNHKGLTVMVTGATISADAILRTSIVVECASGRATRSTEFVRRDLPCDVRSQTVKGRRVPPLRSGILVTQEAYWPPSRARRLPRLESLPSLAGISSRSVLVSLRRLAKALEYASPTLLEKDKALSVGADWAFAFVGSTTWHCHGDKRRQS